MIIFFKEILKSKEKSINYDNSSSGDTKSWYFYYASLYQTIKILKQSDGVLVFNGDLNDHFLFGPCFHFIVIPNDSNFALLKLSYNAKLVPNGFTGHVHFSLPITGSFIIFLDFPHYQGTYFHSISVIHLFFYVLKDQENHFGLSCQNNF